MNKYFRWWTVAENHTKMQSKTCLSMLPIFWGTKIHVLKFCTVKSFIHPVQKDYGVHQTPKKEKWRKEKQNKEESK